MNHPVNLLVTLNDAYIPCMNVMLTSLLHSNPENTFRVFLLHSNISKEKLSQTEEILQGRGELIPITASAEKKHWKKCMECVLGSHCNYIVCMPEKNQKTFLKPIAL